METNVVRGATQTIITYLPIVLFELWRINIKNGESEITNLLKKLGYDIFSLTESHYSKNKTIRRLKRISLVISNGKLNYKLEKVESLESINYPFLVAIHPLTRLNNKKIIHPTLEI